MCLCRFMLAEYDDLPDAVKTEVQTFADVNVAWLARMLSAAFAPKSQCETKTRAIFAAVGGAQLLARSRADQGGDVGPHDLGDLDRRNPDAAVRATDKDTVALPNPGGVAQHAERSSGGPREGGGISSPAPRTPASVSMKFIA